MKRKLSLVIFIMLAIFLFSEDPFWTLVMAGNNIADPIIWNKHIYTISDDRAINCISTSGSFIWRRNTKSSAQFLTISPSGLMFIITKKNTIEAYSSQGIPIWNFSLPSKPIFPAFTSRDGRLFLTLQNYILCFSQQGTLKWKQKLPAVPIQNIVEIGKNELIIILNNGDFFRISMFGKITETKRLKKEITAIEMAPNGYLISLADGSISYYTTSDGSESVWQTNETNICKKIKFKNNKFLAIFQNGAISMRSIKDNSEIWNIFLPTSFQNTVKCYSIKNEYYITTKGFGCLITEDGSLKWSFKVPENTFNPIITENGMIVGITGKIINAYRMEAKLLRKKTHHGDTLGSYTGIYNKNIDIPIFMEDGTAEIFFKEIENSILLGTIGEQEPYYANILIRVMGNTNKASYFPQNFTSYERARAAELLGKLGSYEYRDYLLEEIYKSPDSIFSAGIAKGLGLIGYDPDGKTIEGIKLLTSKSNSQDFFLMTSICEALENLVKFGDEYTAKKAISELFNIVNGGYSNNIQNFARQTLKNIVQ